MHHPYRLAVRAGQLTRMARTGSLVFLLALLLPGATRAQAPAWAAATTGSSTQANGTSVTQATAVDASGNVYVTGYFSGQVAFGSTLLSSVGSNDLFVAKYVPATGTWAWAQSGGGTGTDQGQGIAVSGSSVYVTGYISNNTTNANGVLFGGTGTTPGTVQVNGATTTNSSDLLVAKYTDNGATATLGWTQVGGGTVTDQGLGIAVSGTSVYVTGYFNNSTTNTNGVLFGGTGTTAGTVQVNGATATSSNDLLVTKYTDNGSSATLGWTQVGGGTNNDIGYGIAVSGTSVYVTGSLTNNTANTSGVLFGGTGTTPGTVVQDGATATSSNDLVVAKYTDNGSSATLGWTQVGGGTGLDRGQGIAVSGSSVYVTGFLNNSTANTSGVLFGGTGTTPGTVQVNGATTSNTQDLVVARYTDSGSSATLGWTQVGGGTNSDQGLGIAASGTSVYVTGTIINNTANTDGVLFGSTGTTPGTVQVNGATATSSQDLLVAQYLDNGSSATLGWTQVGGGTGTDNGYGIAVSGTSLYVGGFTTPAATFGAFTIASPVAVSTSFLGALSLVPPPTLPVELTQFTATAEGPTGYDPAAVRLAWATASEKNSDRFEVERSADGTRFERIGTVTAAGSSSSARTYELLDAQLPADAALLYYRLRQVDQDDSFNYSPVRAVSLRAKGKTGLALFPNPASGAATLTGAQPGTVVTVFDALGRLVTSASVDATGTAALALPVGLPAGVYVVRAGNKALRLTVE